MREIRSETTLPFPPADVWDSVRDPSVLQSIARPLFRITPVDPPTFPRRWDEKDYRVGLWLFGLIPFGWQVIGPRFPDTDPGEFAMVDIGRSPLFRQWEHRIALAPTPSGGTRLSDRVRFDAGAMSAAAALGLRLFFFHRHRRLRNLLAGRAPQS